jgi:hypothetical protein
MTVSDYCQRWRDRAASWRHTSEGGFDPARYQVVPIGYRAAEAFVVRHHYAGRYGSDRLRFGLLDRAPRADVAGAIPLDRHGAWLVGVAVLGVPMSVGVLTRPFPRFAPYTETLELSRLVLLDEVAANAESWFVERAFRHAAAAGVRGVVAFSDPVPRSSLAGRPGMPGHVGIVYQSLGAAALGRGTRRSLVRLPDARRRADRQLAADRWALYDVRRIVYGRRGDPDAKGPAWRSVRRLRTGTREQVWAVLDATAARHDLGIEVDPIGPHRLWLHRAGGPPYPTTERLIAAAPAGVADKQRPGFDTAWDRARTDPAQLITPDPEPAPNLEVSA